MESDGSAPVIDRVCSAAVELLSLSGAGLSLMVEGDLRGTAGVSEPGVELVQELQLTLGQGPCVDAWVSGEPVLEADLAEPAVARWPIFAEVAVRAGVRGVFALPLRIGAIGIGVLVLYRNRPGSLSVEELARGLVLADVAAHAILEVQAGALADRLDTTLAQEPAHWAEVHQATGMVSTQLGIPLDDAFVLLRAHSFANNLSLREVAGAVVSRRLRLEAPE